MVAAPKILIMAKCKRVGKRKKKTKKLGKSTLGNIHCEIYKMQATKDHTVINITQRPNSLFRFKMVQRKNQNRFTPADPVRGQNKLLVFIF